MAVTTTRGHVTGERISNQSGISDFTRVLFGLILFLGLPLVYWGKLADPAHLPRFLFMQLILGLMLGQAALTGRLHFKAPHKPHHYCLILFLAAAAGSLIFAGDRNSSFLALLELAIFVQAWLAGTSFDRNDRVWLFRAMVLGGGLVSTIGILQATGTEIPGLAQNFAPAATFVNRNVTAQYLAALLPVSLAMCVLEKHRPAVWIQVFCSALILCYAGLVESRALLMSSAALTLTTCLLVGFRNRIKPNFRPNLKWLPYAAGLLLLALLAAWTNLPVKPIGMLCLALVLAGPLCFGLGRLIAWATPKQRLVAIGAVSILTMLVSSSGLIDPRTILEKNNPDPHVNTAAVRLALYRNSLEMVGDFPLSGVGLGNFRAVYPLYHDRVIPTPTHKITVIPERIHNEFLQYTVELGLIGGGAFTIFFLLLLWRVLQRYLSVRADESDLISGAVVLGLGVVALVSFPLQMPASGLMFWFCAGLINTANPTARKPSKAAFIAVLTISTLILAILLKWCWASMLLKEGNHYQALNRPTEAFAYTRHAYRTFPQDRINFDQLLTLAARHAVDYNDAAALGMRFIAREPHNPNGYFRTAYILKNAKQLDEALAHATRALELAGEDEAGYQLIGLIHLERGDREAARTAFESALKALPNYTPAVLSLEKL